MFYTYRHPLSRHSAPPISVLIVGFLIGEAVGEGRIGGVLRKQLARTKRALRRGREQFARDLADALLHPRLAPLPRFAAEPVECDAVALAAVAREDVEIFDRDVELVAAGVSERDAVLRAAAHPIGRASCRERGCQYVYT